MIVIENEDLSKHVTFRIGGIAERYYIPENREELKNIIKKEVEYKIISGGSNLLINDNNSFPCVIDMHKACNEIIFYENGEVYIGASVRIQHVITTLHEKGLGGFEFLYSLPALFGGIIYMNAGRGTDRKNIGDFVISVKYMDDKGIIRDIDKEQCEFLYRKSVFQKKNWIILGAQLKCIQIEVLQGKEEIRKRVEHCKKTQDMRYPNFGSVFCKCNSKIMRFVKYISVLWTKIRPKSVCFSGKTTNWILNKGKGNFSQTIRWIKFVKLLHKMFNKKCDIEVIIWK